MRLAVARRHLAQLIPRLVFQRNKVVAQQRESPDVPVIFGFRNGRLQQNANWSVHSLSSLWLESAGKGNRISRRTHGDHWIGRLDARNHRSRQEEQCVCGVALCRSFGDRDRAQFDPLSTVRPRNRGVVDLVAWLGHLQKQFELDGAATNPFANLIDKVVGSHLRNLLLSEELLASDGLKLVPTERGNRIPVRKLEGVNTEIRQGCVTHRWWLRGLHEGLCDRMRSQELIEGGWFGSVGSARTYREQKVPELFRCGNGEAVEGQDHDVCLGSIRKCKFHCHAAIHLACIGDSR